MHNRRNEELKYALRGVEKANLYLGVFQETKVTDGVYTRALVGTVSLHLTHRVIIAGEWPFSSGTCPIFKLRLSRNTGVT